MTTVPSPVLLGQVLAHRRLDAMREDYAAHLTWLVGAQLYALRGVLELILPKAAKEEKSAKRLEIGAVVGAAPEKNVRREAPAPGDRLSAEDIRRGVLRRLRRDGARGTKGG